MEWNASKNAGFTDGQPWIRINNNYKILMWKRFIK